MDTVATVVINSEHRKFEEYDGCYSTGTAFYGGKLLTARELATLGSSWDTFDKWLNGLKGLNGFFLLIKIHADGRIWAAVDRVRSVPLFYRMDSGDILVSNDARQLGTLTIDVLDRLAFQEFMLTGYVTLEDTLHRDIKQIRAGHCLVGEETTDGIVPRQERYFTFVHKYETHFDDEWMSELDRTVNNVTRRLIEVAANKTIVVPLSGGLDSRAIVLSLVKAGYPKEKIMTFSYGIPNNEESQVSKSVANALGLQWQFVEYSIESWHTWYNSPHYKTYEDMAFNWSSLPVCQDFPAVWQLHNQGHLPSDSVFVPGHSADLIAGSRSNVLRQLYSFSGFDKRLLLDSVRKYHYSLFRWQQKHKKMTGQFNARIMDSVGDVTGFPDSASAFESWEVNERRAKFIINSLRVYEYWGYDWWIPWWDLEFMEFWSKVPLELRFNQKLWSKYVTQLGYQVADVCFRRAGEQTRWLTVAKQWIKGLLPEKAVDMTRSLVRAKKAKERYHTDPLSWYGVVSEEEFEKVAPEVANINSLLVKKLVDRWQLGE